MIGIIITFTVILVFLGFLTYRALGTSWKPERIEKCTNGIGSITFYRVIWIRKFHEPETDIEFKTLSDAEWYFKNATRPGVNCMTGWWRIYIGGKNYSVDINSIESIKNQVLRNTWTAEPV